MKTTLPIKMVISSTNVKCVIPKLHNAGANVTLMQLVIEKTKSQPYGWDFVL